jgi:hypothetical protein
VNMSNEPKEGNILKLISIMRFACATPDVGHLIQTDIRFSNDCRPISFPRRRKLRTWKEELPDSDLENAEGLRIAIRITTEHGLYELSDRPLSLYVYTSSTIFAVSAAAGRGEATAAPAAVLAVAWPPIPDTRAAPAGRRDTPRGVWWWDAPEGIPEADIWRGI